ncbi:MAG: methyl-accepting chemotaxis protein, partial [Acidobacteriota bacterium]
ERAADSADSLVVDAEKVRSTMTELESIADQTNLLALNAAVEAARLALDGELRTFFDAAAAVHDEAKSVARWLTTELLGRLDDRELADLPFDGGALGALAALVDDGTINNTVGKEVLDVMVAEGGDPAAIVDAEGLRQVTDRGALEPTVDEVLAANPEQVSAYRGGKTALLGFFVGQVMRASGGKADPQLVRELLGEKLG